MTDVKRPEAAGGGTRYDESFPVAMAYVSETNAGHIPRCVSADKAKIKENTSPFIYGVRGRAWS
jgi:hypothetical protein